MMFRRERCAVTAASAIRRTVAAAEALEPRTLLHAGHEHVAGGAVARSPLTSAAEAVVASDTADPSASALLSVSAVTPKTGSVNVPAATNVTVTFAGPVEPTSITTDTIEL